MSMIMAYEQCQGCSQVAEILQRVILRDMIVPYVYCSANFLHFLHITAEEVIEELCILRNLNVNYRRKLSLKSNNENEYFNVQT